MDFKGSDDVSERVGQVRKPRWPLIEWCQTTLEKELIQAEHYLLCFATPGYARVFNLDNGMIYHMTLDSFDALTDSFV